jgi:hypothetical protein
LTATEWRISSGREASVEVALSHSPRGSPNGV